MLARFLKVFVLTMLVMSTAIAQPPPGKGTLKINPAGKVKPQNINPTTPSKIIKHRFSCVDRRGRTFIFSVSSLSDIPPGLRCKAVPPYGLQKKGKHPSGWDEGQKSGW